MPIPKLIWPNTMNSTPDRWVRAGHVAHFAGLFGALVTLFLGSVETIGRLGFGAWQATVSISVVLIIAALLYLFGRSVRYILSDE